jgi:hypothetical protein
MARWGAAGASLQGLRKKSGFLGGLGVLDDLEAGRPVTKPQAVLVLGLVVPAVLAALAARGSESWGRASSGFSGRGSERC